MALPDAFSDWPALGQAQYLEVTTFLSPYLLSSQGDRVAMANSVEGRYPFLDHRVVEFCNRLPPNVKLIGLREKWLLRQLGRRLVPAEVWGRRKRPYRAPIQRSFFGDRTPDYVPELLSETALRESGLYHPVSVGQLARRAADNARLGETDEMLLVGILSTQLLYHQFVKAFRAAPAALEGPIKIVDRVTIPSLENR